jgi:serine/threonine-protein kinase
MFHEACKTIHPKLLAGTCPWCGSFVIEGRVSGLALQNEAVPQGLVEGQTLTQVVESSGPLTAETAARYTCGAAEYLGGIHRQNTIHRDIRPKNIVLTGAGEINILSSPFSRSHNASLVMATNEEVIGLADYLAPEQLNSHNVDSRADIYSLGCTMYYLLCGHSPFPDGTVAERLLKLQTADPRPISDIRPDVPQRLLEICCRMMAKRPEDRFQTADEVATVLRDWLAHGG